MRYDYECSKCKLREVITKPIAMASRIEYCKKCGEQMKRNWTSFGMKTSDGVKG